MSILIRGSNRPLVRQNARRFLMSRHPMRPSLNTENREDHVELICASGEGVPISFTGKETACEIADLITEAINSVD